MSFAQVVLCLSAANWIAAGSFALVLPTVNASLIQIELGSTIAASDLRAVYGGLRLGIGCFLAWAAWTGRWRTGLVAAALLFGGNLLGRGVSILADGVPASPGLALMGLELVGLSLVGVALGQRGSSTSGRS